MRTTARIAIPTDARPGAVIDAPNVPTKSAEPAPKRDHLGRPGADEKRTRRRTTVRQQQLILATATAAAAAAAVAASSAPTELWLIDALYRAGFAGVLTVAGSRSRRWTWALVAGGATVFSTLPFLFVGCLATVLAAYAASTKRNRLHGAAVAAMSSSVLLHLDVPGPTGSATLVGLAVCLPLLVSAVRLLDEEPLRRLKKTTSYTAAAFGVALLLGTVAAVMAGHNVRQGVFSAREGIDVARNGEHAQAMGALIDARDRLSAASSWLSSPLTIGTRAIPVVGQHMRAAQVASGEGTALATASVDVGYAIELDDLRPESGRLDLAAIDGAAAPLERLALTVERTILRLDRVDSPWLIPQVSFPLGRLANELDDIEPGVSTAAHAAKDLPGLLGRDAQADYLLLFTTPAEARGLGGFVGSWAILEADDGELQLAETGRARDINDALIGANAVLNAPEDYADRWGRFAPERHFQDVTFSPDFPTVAAVAADLIGQTGRDVDGVVAIDPMGLAALLRITGPVTLPTSGVELTSNNAVDFLLVDQYEDFAQGGRAVRETALAEASAAVFTALLGADFPDPGVAAAALGPAIDEGRLLAWVPSASGLLRSAGIHGAFPRPETTTGDFLAVTHQNSANNKTDVYLTREIEHRVVYDDATGFATTATTITLQNGAPVSGLADGVLGSNDQGLPPGTNRLYLSVYTPLQLNSASLEGEAFAMETNGELGWRAYSAFLLLGPGESLELELDLSGELPAGGYSLAVSPQPVVTPDQVRVRVSDPTGADVLQEDFAPRADTTLAAGS